MKVFAPSLAALALGSASATSAQSIPGPASASTRADAAHDQAAAEHVQTYSFIRSETDYSRADGADLFTWDAEGWRGGDYNKLWVKTEGEAVDGKVEQAELQALYSRNVSTFFDAQVGVRYDFEPTGRAYLAAGFQGLAPYQFETEATAFLSDRGDLSFRYKQTLDLLFTQKLILQPHLELNAYASDVPDRGIGAGIADIDAGLQLRYEFTRKLAPYLDLNYARSLGETAVLTRAAGGSPEDTTLRAGLRVWF